MVILRLSTWGNIFTQRFNILHCKGRPEMTLAGFLSTQISVTLNITTQDEDLVRNVLTVQAAFAYENTQAHQNCL